MKKIITLLCCFVLAFAFGSFPNNDVKANEGYVFTPTPHNITYLEGTTTLLNNVHIVKGEGASDETVVKLREVLSQQGKIVTSSSEKVEGATNVLLTTNVSHPLLANEQLTLASNGYDKYSLKIKDGSISILGQDDDALYYGVATLTQILKQAENTLKHLSIQDYANVKYRGFIEGYYGFPWSNANRKSLMEFGGQFKTNTYIFAPKDDPYHSSNWRTLYPETELNQLRELVEVGKKTRTKFVWTIHPFMSRPSFSFTDYDQDYGKLIAKFEQLYSIGVRQFGILADDVGNISRDNLLRLLNDVSRWAHDKGDVEDILFCPAGYNHAWQGNYSELKTLNRAPDNVQFFWTGDTVVNKVTNRTVENFINGSSTSEKAGRAPYFWLNWSVNDYKKGRLLMGPGEVLTPGVTNLAGLVTNPMPQAEASKVAIFAVADYAWNSESFNKQQSWEKGFPYIETNTPDALKEIAKHLQDVSPSGHGLVLPESEELAPLIEQFKQAYESQAANTSTNANQLIAKYEALNNAVQTFKTSGANKVLIAEMSSWLDSLSESAQAAINYLKGIISDNQNEVWNGFAKGNVFDRAARSHIERVLGGTTVVEAGFKRILPFNNYLSTKLNEKLNIRNDGESQPLRQTPFYSTTGEGAMEIAQNDISKLTDGDNDSYVSFKSTTGHFIPKNGYFGVEFNRVANLKTVEVIQTRPGASNDKFINSIVEYSLDGVEYKELTRIGSEEHFRYTIPNTVKAKYLRVRATQQIPYWASVKALNITESNEKPLLTNVDEYKELIGEKQGLDRFSLPNNTYTLKPGQYVGLDLSSIRDIKEITTGNTNLTLEVSDNDVVYHPYDATKATHGRYVRVKNNTDSEQSVTTLNVVTKEVYPVSQVASNFASVENPAAAFDGDLNTPAWLKDSQITGKHYVWDLGQEISLSKIKMLVNDSEHDYIRHGKLSVSRDNSPGSYEEVLNINATDDEDIVTAFPEYSAPHRYKENSFAEKRVRYIRFEVTKNKEGADKWVRFQEIVLNDGMYLPQQNRPQINVTGTEVATNNKSLVDDNSLTTSYKDSNRGELIYKIDNSKRVKSIKVLTSGDEKMNISVMNQNEQWIDKGELKNTYETIDVSRNKNTLALRLSWDKASRAIHEIIVEYGEPDPTKTTALEAEIAKESTLNKDLYTSETLKAYEELLKRAKASVNDDTLTQAEIDELTAQLVKAREALVEKPKVDDNKPTPDDKDKPDTGDKDKPNTGDKDNQVKPSPDKDDKPSLDKDSNKIKPIEKTPKVDTTVKKSPDTSDNTNPLRLVLLAGSLLLGLGMILKRKE